MTGAGSLSPSPQPVTDDPSALSLSGRCGVSPQKGSAETVGSDAGEGVPRQKPDGILEPAISRFGYNAGTR